MIEETTEAVIAFLKEKKEYMEKLRDEALKFWKESPIPSSKEFYHRLYNERCEVCGNYQTAITFINNMTALVRRQQEQISMLKESADEQKDNGKGGRKK